MLYVRAVIWCESRGDAYRARFQSDDDIVWGTTAIILVQRILYFVIISLIYCIVNYNEQWSVCFGILKAFLYSKVNYQKLNTTNNLHSFCNTLLPSIQVPQGVYQQKYTSWILFFSPKIHKGDNCLRGDYDWLASDVTARTRLRAPRPPLSAHDATAPPSRLYRY